MMYPHLMRTLKTVLKGRGWTYARLGREIGLSESGVKKIFSADDGSFERIVRICAALDLTLEALLDLADSSPEPWRLTDEQEAYFRRAPRCWWFLQCLAAERWDLDALTGRLELDPVQIEGWLSALERRDVIRRTDGGRIHPVAAAGRPWQGGHDFGDALVAPQQDALIAHARRRIRDPDDHPLPGHTECGYSQLRLKPPTILEFKDALRRVVTEFATRSRRQQLIHGAGELIDVGVLTVMAPFSISDHEVEPGHP